MRPIRSATERRRLRVDRYNSNTLRRYHIPGGAIIVVRSHDRTTAVLPAWCNHISAPCTRSEAASYILAARASLRHPAAP